MPNLAVLSDIHMEFHPDCGEEFAKSLDPTGVDVLVLAGDISEGPQIPRALGYICKQFKDSAVLYVHGNHEFYNNWRDEVIRFTLKAIDENPNLIWLDNSCINLNGQKFVGTPLWFRDQGDRRKDFEFSDFFNIHGYDLWVYNQNSKALNLLDAHLEEGDILITHHLPSKQCVDEEYRGSDNSYFVCDVEDIILERKPKLVIFGHTHTSVDKMICDTRVVCNPYGYQKGSRHSIGDLNPQWNSRKIIEF